MGHKCWVMLPFAPDWRWLTGRTDSPWYPTLRLFRPPAPRAWPAVVAEIAAALSPGTHYGVRLAPGPELA